MKIKKIVLYNIGPYIGENSFNLSLYDDKNIVLIGGKNGAGKTTFFKSIKTCLYGCRVWGFDAPGKEYYNIIEGLVNMKAQFDNTIKAYIEIELFFDDGKQQNIYTLHREWFKEKKTFGESYFVYKNNIELSIDEVSDFNNYLLTLIPPDMFNFYFFDGESIADFFLGNEGNKNFKNAFLKLYGLDTLSIMIENFERHSKKKENKGIDFDSYNIAKKNLFDEETKLKTLLDKKKYYEEQIDYQEIQIKTLQDEYIKQGGVSLSEWKELNSLITREEAKRDEINRWLKDIANHYLPFIILKKEITELELQLQNEQESKKSIYLQEIITKSSFIAKLQEYLNKENLDIHADNIINFICDAIDNDKQYTPIFDLSSAQLQRILSQIEDKKEFNTNEILQAVKSLNSSLNLSKKYRNKMLNSSIEEFGNYSETKAKFEKNILDFSFELEKLNQEILLMDSKISDAKTNFEKVKTIYEEQLKSKSISDISSRAVIAYTLLEERLIKRQSALLQNEFIKCFNSIINKDNFIDGIVIDNNISIIPYKYVKINLSQIENYLTIASKNKFLDYFGKEFLVSINNLRIGKVNEIELPSPITAPFSQGERQVYIMSLYLALLKTSRREIPFFIDTPFARIDSNHRDKIVSEFFKGITNQLFILSTDEEIVGEYKELIDKSISNEFLLDISSYGKTEIKENNYFGE